MYAASQQVTTYPMIPEVVAGSGGSGLGAINCFVSHDGGLLFLRGF